MSALGASWRKARKLAKSSAALLATVIAPVTASIASSPTVPPSRGLSRRLTISASTAGSGAAAAGVDPVRHRVGPDGEHRGGRDHPGKVGGPRRPRRAWHEQRILELELELLEVDHPDTLSLMHNLGGLYRRQGRFDPKVLASGDVDEIWRLARDAGVISAQEYALVERRNVLRDKVIRVDDFPYDFGLKSVMRKLHGHSPAQDKVEAAE